MFAKQSLQRIVAMTGSIRSKVPRQALLMAKQQPTFMAAAISPRNFSTDILNDGAKKLGKALEKEIKYENDNYTQLEDIETFLNESGF